jgi:hypothetical protein
MLFAQHHVRSAPRFREEINKNYEIIFIYFFSINCDRRPAMVKKGEEQVSSADSPRQGEKRNPKEGKIKHKGEGSKSQTRARPQAEGSGADG